MLPTPSETPRKRPLQTEASLKSTARVLFPSRPANIDEVVPTPRKSRKTKDLFTLESFANAAEEAPEKIQIFTDSKERVPERDDEEDNPFVVKKGKGKARAAPQKPKKTDARAEQMNAAADRDEGIVYLFRGRKIFRKFHDAAQSDGSEGDAMPLEERMVRRQVGTEAHRPLTRSSIKPRLLFQEEIKERNRRNGQDEDDEEAETEIEAHVQTPSKRKAKTAAPLVQPSLETTPPPTVRKAKRGMFTSPDVPTGKTSDASSEISFDSWSRVKSSHSSSGSVRESKKRRGDPLEREADKRARSEKSTSSMSLDSV
jgi:hypothetical protein